MAEQEDNETTDNNDTTGGGYPDYPLRKIPVVWDKRARDASKTAVSDWGPIFVYGMLTSKMAWAALIDRVPIMHTGLLRTWRRFGVRGTGMAAIVEDENWTVVGQVVQGLNPWERRLIDMVIDDAFRLVDVSVEILDLSLDGRDPNIKCTTYAWREEINDAWPSENPQDWDVEHFTDEYLTKFIDFCKDTAVVYSAARMSDKELKELALARKRRDPIGGDADEAGYVSEDDADEDEDSD
jgi:hypothetical protein